LRPLIFLKRKEKKKKKKRKRKKEKEKKKKKKRKRKKKGKTQVKLHRRLDPSIPPALEPCDLLPCVTYCADVLASKQPFKNPQGK
jgi:hypothetical protein